MLADYRQIKQEILTRFIGNCKAYTIFTAA